MRKALVLMNVDLGFEPELQAELKKIKQITGTHEVYGVYDIVVEIEAKTEKELKRIVFSRIRRLRHVRSKVTLTASP